MNQDLRSWNKVGHRGPYAEIPNSLNVSLSVRIKAN